MRKIYFLLILVCFVFCGSDPGPDRPEELTLIRGVNPQNDLAGYRLCFFAIEQGDSLEAGIEFAVGDLVWTRFIPPTRWSKTYADTAVNSLYSIDMPNQNVTYSHEFGRWNAEFSFIIAMPPGLYKAQLQARSRGGARSGLSDPVVIKITGGE